MAKRSKLTSQKANKDVKGGQYANTKPAAEQPEKNVKLARSRKTAVAKARKGNAPRSKQSEPAKSISRLLMSPWATLTTAPPMDAVKAIRKGLPSCCVGKTARSFGLLPGELSVLTGILHGKDNQGQKRRRRLTTHESNILYRAMLTLRRAELTMDSLDAAIKWMREPVLSLGGQCPLSLMDTGAGCDLVARTLASIEHGLSA